MDKKQAYKTVLSDLEEYHHELFMRLKSGENVRTQGEELSSCNHVCKT